MKRYISTAVLFILMLSTVCAQLDRSTPPEPGPAPEVKIGDYRTFKLPNDLTVIVVEDHKVPAVSYSLTLDIKLPREEESAGYIDMAGDLLRAGTTNRSKAEIDEAVDFIGASLNTHAKGIYARSLSKHSDQLLEIMSDVLLNPVFPQEELDKLVTQQKTSNQASKEEPRAIAQNIARTLVYGKNDPYGEIVTEETLENITVDMCQNYYNDYFRPNEAYLVVVGDVTPKEVKKQAKKYFGDWEKDEVPKNQFDYPEGYNEPKVAIANKEGANQSTVMVTHDVNLTPGHPDVIKTRVMNQILGGGSFNARLFQNLREDKGFTYGAYSSLNADERVGRFTASAQVRTSVTDSALTEILNEMKSMRSQPVGDDELQLVKNVIAGDFGRSLEDPQTVARFALNIERYDLPKDYYENYLKNVESVTKEEILEMANEYLKPDQAVILAVGNVADIENKMTIFSPSRDVTQYNYYGNVVEKKAASKDVTAAGVVDAYIDAIGGKEKLKSVDDLQMSMSMTVQGMGLNMNMYQKKPNKFYMETLMNGNVMSMQVFDGEKGKIKSPQGEQMLEGDALDQMKQSARIFPELTFLQDSVTLKLEGIEKVDGKETYKVITTKPSGSKSTAYYGVDDGLKHKEVMNTPQGTISTTFSDYKETNGILFPTSMKQVVGPQNFSIQVDSISVNSGIDVSRFSVEE